MPRNSVELGWGARPIKEQHPVLSKAIADHFDRDNVALSRLRVRGFVTDSEHRSIVKRLTKKIAAEIQAALARL